MSREANLLCLPLVTAVVVTLAVFLPSAAFACPSCASRESPGTGTFTLIGALIGFPYLVAAVAFRMIRRIDRKREPHG